MEEAAETAQDMLVSAMLLEVMVGFLIPLAYFAVMVTIAWAIGRHFERSHLKRLAEGEAELRSLPAVNIESPLVAGQSALVSGSVVVANDMFKAWRARWRSLIGGNITHYETMVARARREAVLRMKREAASLGASHVCGVRLQSTQVGTSDRASGVEVLAYGTAVVKG